MNKPSDLPADQRPEPYLVNLPKLDPYSAFPRRVIRPTWAHGILLFTLAVMALAAAIGIVIGNP